MKQTIIFLITIFICSCGQKSEQTKVKENVSVDKINDSANFVKYTDETEKKIIWDFYNGKFIEAPSTLAQLQRHELNALVLLSIQRPIDLCSFLRMGFNSVEKLINSPSYKYFTIKKKKGGEREIHAPNQSLKLVQKHLNYYFKHIIYALNQKKCMALQSILIMKVRVVILLRMRKRIS